MTFSLQKAISTNSNNLQHTCISIFIFLVFCFCFLFSSTFSFVNRVRPRSLSIYIRPVGRGGSRGFARTPLLASKRFYTHCFNCTLFKCLTIGKWSTSSLAAIENHRCPSKSGCSYADLRTMLCRTRARKLFTPLRRKAARKYVRK